MFLKPGAKVRKIMRLPRPARGSGTNFLKFQLLLETVHGPQCDQRDRPFAMTLAMYAMLIYVVLELEIRDLSAADN